MRHCEHRHRRLVLTPPALFPRVLDDLLRRDEMALGVRLVGGAPLDLVAHIAKVKEVGRAREVKLAAARLQLVARLRRRVEGR